MLKLLSQCDIFLGVFFTPIWHKTNFNLFFFYTNVCLLEILVCVFDFKQKRVDGIFVLFVSINKLDLLCILIVFSWALTDDESLYKCLCLQVPTGFCFVSQASMARTRLFRSVDHTAQTTRRSCRDWLHWVRQMYSQLSRNDRIRKLIISYMKLLPVVVQQYNKHLGWILFLSVTII